ncbi:hypothetical protein BDA99DRAFT_574707 [Phascolomyces articulosus]|uniref:Uncharacterized protein n=1 Tax=Phascolomyces articulosus TaxID=60185 RepID=A0AAD5K694_9FUNG|nr:hypothetical protein BDA99DRAFT_574707 [Phascolomyces articulosus]
MTLGSSLVKLEDLYTIFFCIYVGVIVWSILVDSALILDSGVYFASDEEYASSPVGAVDESLLLDVVILSLLIVTIFIIKIVFYIHRKDILDCITWVKACSSPIPIRYDPSCGTMALVFDIVLFASNNTVISMHKS